MPQRKIRVGNAADFKQRNPIKFSAGKSGGFVVLWKGEFLGYENVCRHVALPLDYGDGEFFSPDGQFLLCRNHGALYDPATGLCVSGPCQGAGLRRIPVLVEGGEVWAEFEE